MRPDAVLLVDDEIEFVSTLAERMRARGLDVDFVTSGVEALQLAKQKTFDAVVLDIAMPGMDGIETLKHLLEDQPDLQVVLLSGQATVKTAVEASKLGAVDVLEKPADVETLVGLIREARAARLAKAEERTQEEIEEIMRTKGW